MGREKIVIGIVFFDFKLFKFSFIYVIYWILGRKEIRVRREAGSCLESG